MEDKVKVGRVSKAVELATCGKLKSGTALFLTDSALDARAAEEPCGCLESCESLYYALRDQRYVSGDGRIVAMCLRGNRVDVHALTVADDGAITSWETSVIALPEGKWLDSKKVSRSKKYRR